MKKKNVAILVALVFAVSIFVGAGAAELIRDIRAEQRKDFVVKVDGVEQNFKSADGKAVYPILYDGTTYLPVRAVSELFGKTVYWNEATKEIDIRTEKAPNTTVTDADVIIPAEENPKTESPASDGTTITKDEAKAIALEKAGLKEADVRFVKVELDRERGIAVYDVEFNHGTKEYNAEIKADDGTILEWDVEYDD